MLKITTNLSNGLPCVLKLEGKLLAPWIDELQAACHEARARSPSVALDLADVSFADAPGAIALRDLVRRGVAVVACSPFIAEVLKGD
jgi:anti-anti-sigma regulatory factor